MFYSSELDFLISTIGRLHLQTHLLDVDMTEREWQKYCSSKLLYRDAEENAQLYKYIIASKPNTIYKVIDLFGCTFLFMRLDSGDGSKIFAVGPFFSQGLSRQDILEKSEELSLNAQQANELVDFYSTVPFIRDYSTLFVLIESFAELVFGGSDKYDFTEITNDSLEMPTALKQRRTEDEERDNNYKFLELERRYAYENALIDAVRHGNSERAELMLTNVTDLSLERRLSDPLRNLKNYCIIMNTLLRKAAENSGVHPLYIDRVSSDFANKIELVPEVDDIGDIMREMFKTYCRLVRKHTFTNLSPTVRKAILYIDSDPARELSLSVIAKQLNLSAAYLSAIFKKEMGKTITDFINERRISHAKLLLKTTALQIQTVAAHCGFLDVHYFSRVFKKIVRKTPKSYRSEKR